MGGPDQLHKFVAAFAQGARYAHAVMVDASLTVTGVQRFAADIDPARAVQLLARNTAPTGALRIIIQVPDALGLERIRWGAEVVAGMEQVNLNVVDIIATVDGASGPLGYQSAEETGAMMFREPQTDYGGNVVREQPDLFDKPGRKPGKKERGDGPQRRGMAKRVEADPSFADLHPGMKGNPTFDYQPQRYKEIDARLEAMTSAERVMAATNPASVNTPSDENFSVKAAIYEMNEMRARGEDPMPLMELLAKQGTTFAQLVRQMAELKTSTPEGGLMIIEKMLDKHGRTLKPDAKADLLKRIEADLQARKDLHDAEDALFRTFDDAEARRVRDAERRADAANRRLMKTVRDVAPREISRMLVQAIQGNLLVPLSHVMNAVSDVVFLPLIYSSQSIGASLDLLDTMIRTLAHRARGSEGPAPERTLLQPFWGLGSYGQGFAEGTKAALKQIVTGHDPSVDLIGGEKMRGFRPFHAMRQFLTGHNLPVDARGRVPTGDRLKALLEATIGPLPEASLRVLNLEDKPFRYGRHRQILNEQGRIKGLKGKDLDKFIRFPSKKALEVAGKEAAEAVWQQQNRAAAVIENIVETGAQTPLIGGALRVFAKSIMPYSRTPTNLIVEGMQFALPDLSLGMAYHHSKQGNRRKAYMSIGKAVTGQMMLLGAYYLVRKGLLKGNPDDRAKIRELQRGGGQPPQTINISGLQRDLDGDDYHWHEGDEVRGFMRMGFAGLIFNLVASAEDRKRREAAKEMRPIETAATDWVLGSIRAAPEIMNTALQLPMLKGQYEFLRAVQLGSYDRWLATWFRAASSIVLPNWLDTMNKSQIWYMPDMRGEDTIGDFENIVAARLLNTDHLPLRRDLFGRPIPTVPEGTTPAAWYGYDVTQRRVIPTDPWMSELRRVYEATGNADVVPSYPSRTFRVQGRDVEMSPRQYEKLTVSVGDARMVAFDRLLNSAAYQGLSYEMRGEALKKIWSMSDALGRRRFQGAMGFAPITADAQESLSTGLQEIIGAGR